MFTVVRLTLWEVVLLMVIINWCTLSSPPLPLLLSSPSSYLYIACGGTSQDGTDEGDDGSTGSRLDVTVGHDAEDGAYTSSECTEYENDFTPSPSQSSEHAGCMDM